MQPFALVVAATQKGGIAHKGGLPWPHLSDDMKFFRQLTTDGTVIMGRKTFQEMGKPLPNRQNIVVSTTLDAKTGGVLVVPSLAAGLAVATTNRVFVIGGAKLYAEAMEHPLATKIYLTQILEDYPADTFIPPIPSNYALTKVGKIQVESQATEGPLVCFQFLEYDRRSDEYQYLDMVKSVLATGTKKMDRTGTGTISKFGCTSRYNLREGVLPLLTTKRVYWKGVVEELLWMISGCTDAKVLSSKGVTIWDANGTREFLDKQGLTDHKVGDLGPIYGFQWRHFGATYPTADQGIDQLAEVIAQLKTNPTSRRVVMSAWNPVDLKKMALPPCHVLSQFTVDNGELSCILYQRSGDLGLGVPFNIASYSLLTIMVAHLTGLKPGEFIHMLGDTHVYLNHVEPLQEQLKRTPTAFPKLRIKRTVESIDDFKADDFELVGYTPQASISMQMSA